ncbi:MAG: alanine:cation symporter family protein [Bdellovibrionaceae bacterium]|nr:alanine:cation symporter family protein [Pseudobdellovibrionaceae bacterium]
MNFSLKSIHHFATSLSDLAWGWPLVFLLVGGGIYLIIYSRGLPLRGLGLAIQLVSGRFHHKDEEKAPGQLSHFKALSNAIAATVGLGNIGGVAVAISTGGPGAVFWMWVTAFIGMNTKFFECTLSVMFRGKDYLGEVQGGPMYVIEMALPKKLHWLAYLFAIFGLLGCMAMYNVNQLAEYLEVHYNMERMWVGIFVAIFISYILMGGIRRMAQFTSSLVPFMCVVYILSCLIILVINYQLIPSTLWSIIREALLPSAVGGGTLGWAFKEVLIVGVKRAAFSNEAGIGTAPMAHSNVKTNQPISEGLVAMLGPLIDTLIICSMTALVILISFPNRSYMQAEGVLLTLSAFEKSLPHWGGHILGISIVLFSITTMIGMANYNEKCWNFLFKGRWGLGEKTFIVFFAFSLWLGALFPLETALNFIDAGLGFMAFPNMIATIILAPKVGKALKEYFAEFINTQKK